MSARRLIILTIAFVLLLGGVAFAEDAIDAVTESDGTWNDAGLFRWRYDAENGELVWGAEDCGPELADVTPSTEATDGTEPPACRTVAIGEPAPADEEPSVEEPSHGNLVSAFAKDVKAADEAGAFDEGGEFEDVKNRGSLISALAKLNPFKGDSSDDDDGDSDELKSKDVDDDDDRDDSADDRPSDKSNNGKAKGKDK